MMWLLIVWLTVAGGGEGHSVSISFETERDCLAAALFAESFTDALNEYDSIDVVTRAECKSEPVP